MRYLPLTGRILYSFIFLNTLLGHFSEKAIGYAASKGVPMPAILVPLSAIIAAAGAVSIILGYKTRIGAWLIVLFLVPVTFMMHAFWKETDPMQMQMQVGNFLKNLSLLGAALLLAYFGPGPVSLDEKLPAIPPRK
jgi:putative oxidoreductase